jgi:hypothetical protein
MVRFLRAINPAEADAFKVPVVEDFDGVAVNYLDYSSDGSSNASLRGETH